MNQGTALARIGRTITEWWDISNGYPGVYQTGTFDPTRDDTSGRYGLVSLSAIRYEPNDYEGSHAFGLNSQVTPEILAAELSAVVGEPVVVDGHWLLDMNLLKGATAYIVARALASGRIAPAPIVPVTPPAQPPVAPPPPAAPPAASGLPALSPTSQRVEELRVMVRALTLPLPVCAGVITAATRTAWPAAKPFAVEALRLYRLIRAKLGDGRPIPAGDRWGANP